ncbi:hypothetical protein H920_11883 [Fukomys damarensis]|uniref:Uncharacterized protein n=1 Tax=Fukomys damarensis TaxID=885580 RepID=A0A091D966_FUKDA|nr:hypothetical protein H920_11883 [Fukomys damarensis]
MTLESSGMLEKSGKDSMDQNMDAGEVQLGDGTLNSKEITLMSASLLFRNKVREQKGKKEASEQKKKDKDNKPDSEEQDRSREEENDEDEERLEEEEQNEEEEVDN